MDAELRAILAKRKLECYAWRLEEKGILSKTDLRTLWVQDKDFFGSDGYSRGSFEIVKYKLRKYAPKNPRK